MACAPASSSSGPGPLFADVLLADEINRAPPKTQAALLEAMEERQVTVDGESHPLPDPFFVLATQNPIEYEGTYPLPEAQLDRFLMKVAIDYPEADEERAILRLAPPRARADALVDSSAREHRGPARGARRGRRPRVRDDVVGYVVADRAPHARAPSVPGREPAGAVHLLGAARPRAAGGAGYVTPDDVGAWRARLRHRLMLTPEAESKARRRWA